MLAPRNNTVLISGAGVAGPALAYWLLRRGYRPTLVETAPALRQGGYMIDFWGVGYDVAERMGLIGRLRAAGYNITELRMVDDRGQRIGSMNVEVLRSATGDRFFSILRSDLAREVYRTIDGKVETIFGDTVTAIEQDDAGVDVAFKHAQARRFDLLFGADGLHSVVRDLVFGEEERFEDYLGYYVASFDATSYPHRDADAYVSHTVPGRQIARYAFSGNRSAFFFIWIEDRKLKVAHHDIAAQKEIIRQRFGGIGWEGREILDALEGCSDLYFDAVSQIHIKPWWQGRAALLGDAAYCPSLLAGQGAAFALTGAYVLAGELERAQGDHIAAFRNYGQRLRPFIEGKQRAARNFGNWFAPRTSIGVTLRNQLTRLTSAPFVGDWLVRRMFGDRFDLPDYPLPAEAPTAREPSAA